MNIFIDKNDILNRIHDRDVILSEIIQSANQGEWHLPISVESNEPQSTEKKFIVKYGYYPVYEASIILKNVADLTIIDSAEIDACNINTYINDNEKGLQIIGTIPVNIIAKGNNVTIELHVFDNVLKLRRAFLGFW